jgi:hypothetical protein
MELTLLTVPACPNAAAFEEPLAAALAGHPGPVARRREIADELEAAAAVMHGVTDAAGPRHRPVRRPRARRPCGRGTHKLRTADGSPRPLSGSAIAPDRASNTSGSGISAPFATNGRSVLGLADACDISSRWSCRSGVCHPARRLCSPATSSTPRHRWSPQPTGGAHLLGTARQPHRLAR